MNKILYCFRSLYTSSFLPYVRLSLNNFYAFMTHWSIWEIYFNVMNVQGDIVFQGQSRQVFCSKFLVLVVRNICVVLSSHEKDIWKCKKCYIVVVYWNVGAYLASLTELGNISQSQIRCICDRVVAGRVYSRANRKHSTYRRTTELEPGQLPDCAQRMVQFGAESPVQVGNQHQIWLYIHFALHNHIPFLSSELLLWTPCGWFLWHTWCWHLCLPNSHIQAPPNSVERNNPAIIYLFS